MKNFLLAVLALASFSAFADQLDDQIVDQVDRLSRSINRGELRNLSRSEREDLRTNLNISLRILRDDDRRNPPRGPQGPGPRGPGQREINVTALLVGNVGHRVVNLSGRSIGDMFQGCRNQVNNLGVLTKIAITVNNDTYDVPRPIAPNLFNSDDICNELLRHVNVERPGYENRINVSGNLRGTMGTYTINLNGYRSEILRDCVSQAGNNGNWLQEFNLSINRTGFKRTTYPMQHMGPGAACIELTKLIDAEVR